MRCRLAGPLIILTACAPIGCAPAQPLVEQHGAMREVMRQGRTESRISLADAVARSNTVAVGALEGLDGEITIVDGDVWVSRVSEGGLRITGPDLIETDHATLLTLAHVSRWRSISIKSPAEGRQLESLIEQTAQSQGIDTDKPFPFVIEGKMAGLDLHVINGYCPIATDPASVDAEPWRQKDTQFTDVTIVGFFAPGAAGVMTHHGTLVHAHAILSIDGRTITGHIDRVSVALGMILRVPAVR